MTEIEPPFRSRLFREDTRRLAPTGVAELPGVTADELDAYGRVYDGPGRPSAEDLEIATRLDRELEEVKASAPETTVWDVRLSYHDEPADAKTFENEEEAKEMAMELLDWLQEASTIQFRVGVEHNPYHGWVLRIIPPSISAPTSVRRDSEGYRARSTYQS